MTVADTTVALEFSNIVAGISIPVAIQTNGDPVTIHVAYGADRLPATINTDYVIVIAIDLLSFTLTPTASLLDKIDIDGPNIIFVSRLVLLTTDFDQDDAFVREKLVSEFDEVWMALQQVTNAASGDAGDASQDAAAAAASAAAAEVSEDNAETYSVSAQVAAAAASGSADSAIASASSATSSATAAATSATDAANSAIASANSATQAASSVAAIGNPATVAHTDIAQTWTATQTFGAITATAVPHTNATQTWTATQTFAAITASTGSFSSTLTVTGVAALNAGGTLGNAAGDAVTIKGTVVDADISALFDATTVANFGQEILDSLLTLATPVATDQMIFRDISAGPADYRYHNITTIVNAGLLGLPNI